MQLPMLQLKIALVAGVMLTATLSLTACGFALRGTSSASHIAIPYSQATIVTADNPESYELRHKLATRLSLLGVSTDGALLSTAVNSPNQIRIEHVNQRRYQLVGALSEVRLVLTADVSFQLGAKRVRQQVQVERSYQLNEAGVTTQDQQGEQAQRWLQDHLAERIAEQYYALSLDGARQ